MDKLEYFSLPEHSLVTILSVLSNFWLLLICAIRSAATLLFSESQSVKVALSLTIHNIRCRDEKRKIFIR